MNAEAHETERIDDVPATGPRGDDLSQPLGGKIDIAFKGNGRLHLEQIGTHEGTQHDLLSRRPHVEPVPRVPAKSLQDHVGDDRAGIQSLAGEADVERLPDKTPAAVAADEIAGPDRFLANRTGDARGNALGVLRDTCQFAAKLRVMAEFGQTLAHHAFGHELRKHQRAPIGLGWRRIAILRHRRVLVAAVVAIHPLRRIKAAAGDEPVDDAQVLEHFQAARLDALAARAAERVFHLFDQPEGDAPPGEVDRQREARRPGAANQDIGGGILWHCLLRDMCIMHIYGGGADAVKE